MDTRLYIALTDALSAARERSPEHKATLVALARDLSDRVHQAYPIFNRSAFIRDCGFEPANPNGPPFEPAGPFNRSYYLVLQARVRLSREIWNAKGHKRGSAEHGAYKAASAVLRGYLKRKGPASETK